MRWPAVQKCCNERQNQVSILKYTLQALIPGGTLALSGLRCDTASFPLPDYVWKEIKMAGISLYANRYPTAIDLIASGE